MCKKAFEKDPLWLEYVPDCFKTQGMFKKAIEKDPLWLEYVPDCFKKQGMCKRASEKDSWLLRYVPDHLKTQETCTQAVSNNPYLLEHVPDYFKTQKMCKGVHFYPWLIGHVPDHFKTQEMCNKVVKVDPSFLRFVPDWFVSQEQLKLCHDIDDWLIRWWDNNKLIKWYDDYKKRKAEKAKIKEELQPITWHPSTYWDWCMSEDEKKKKKKKNNYEHKHRLFLYLMTGYKNFLTQKEQQTKMSSLLNVSNDSRKPEEFSLKDIEVLADNKEQNWFKTAHIGRHLGIARIITSTSNLSEEYKRSRAFLQAEGGIRSMDPPREDAQDHDILTGALYVTANS